MLPLNLVTRHLVEFLNGKFPGYCSSTEAGAAITHLTAHQDSKPPLMPEDVYQAGTIFLAGLIRAGQYVDPKTIAGTGDKMPPDSSLERRFPLLDASPHYTPEPNPDFTFADLFSGIGGFRIACQEVGGKCLFSCEWDRFAKLTYQRNFGEIPYGDIRGINEQDIPDHDLLCAGFPCQPFSLAGVSKKNALGREHGFKDKTQGTLFFELARIIAAKRPPAFFLENVKNLRSHDQGKTFKTITDTLENELGYVINWKIVDGSAWVPQHRERIFIIGYDPDQVNISKEEIIIPNQCDDQHEYKELRDIIQKKTDNLYTLGPGTWNTLERHKENHAAAGNGFGYGLHGCTIPKGAQTRTISARYHKDGAEILISQKGKRPRRLTVEEAMQLQGFDPRYFSFPVSNTQAYRQIGNSVVVPAIGATAREIATVLQTRKRNQPNPAT